MTVQPSVETVARKMQNEAAWIGVVILDAQADAIARAVLALIGGRTEAEVKAEALEAAAEYAEYSGLHITLLDEPRSAEKWTSKRAQMIADGLRARAAAIRGEQ